MAERVRLADIREAAPKCALFRQDPYPFAWCETHDETFPLGATCPETLAQLRLDAIACRARGDIGGERRALDLIALDERARRG